MNILKFIPEVVFIGLYTASLVWFCRRLLHIFQLEEYQSIRLIRWGIKSRKSLYQPLLVAAAVISLAAAIIATALTNSIKPDLIISSVLAFAAAIKTHPADGEAKKPLVYTNRARRIITVSGLVGIVISVLWVFLIGSNTQIYLQGLIHFTVVAAVPVAAMLCLLVGNILLKPVESVIRRRYEQSARAILAEHKALKRVGITGSYGKTTTKVITHHLLSSKYKTLATPQSYNTFLGIIRVIREELKPFHEIFVVEMGAYIPGEIKKICGLVHPDISVITEVGPQHLERFGTIEHVAEAKYEIVQGLPKNGTLIIYADNPYCAELADRAKSEGYTVLKYGITSDVSGLDVSAAEIEYSRQGTSFLLQVKGAAARKVEIPLLSYHNVLNVLAATLVALQFDISLEEIIRSCASIPAIPHRLELIKTENGISIIDDSYNSNVVGVHNALDLLEKIAFGGKIIVTPGIVELGEVEHAENYRFGEHIARVCSQVILVGLKQTKPIQEGLQSCGFPAERMAVVADLKEATLELGKIARQGDTVLFSNDLPDNYSE
ncbi:MAG: UDP-N-acetylmuramoyl-tripeptide--D-alanyl-D-alanine ligase [Anaerolineaceae bacterium]|nr:UDP-N-acetylmuramoyl-tripeptide--D-alanyl-D-alanine ligase [Anaerolineaceae bacterium]